MADKSRTAPNKKRSIGTPVVAKSRTAKSRTAKSTRGPASDSESNQDGKRRPNAKKTATGARIGRPATATNAATKQERIKSKKSSVAEQPKSRSAKPNQPILMRKNVRKSVNKSVSKTSSAPQVEQNRPQGLLEAKRKREKAKRKRRYDSALEGLKERTHIDSVEKIRHWSSAFIVSYWHKSKLTSALLLGIAVSLIYLIFTEPQFFVYADDVTFNNLDYLYPEELYPDLEIDGWSVFWIQTDSIRETIVNHRYVADADVSIKFPARIVISVEEEMPIALWVTDQGQKWILADGSALPTRSIPTESLLQILDGQQDAAVANSVRPFLINAGQPEAAAVDDASLAANIDAVTNINHDVLESALNLAKRYPGLDTITYNRGYGLNFTIPQRTEWIYWGNGGDFSQKLENMAAIHHIIAKNGVTASVIDLRSPEKPYYR